MTQDEIIEMVREAGGSDVGGHGWTTWVGTQSTEFLERFANLVAAKEREACAEALAQTQEPVAWWNDTGTHIDLNVSGRGTPLYTTPPQRTWVDLTDDEYFALQMKIKAPMISVQDYIDAMRMVEAKLKEKNT